MNITIPMEEFKEKMNQILSKENTYGHLENNSIVYIHNGDVTQYEIKFENSSYIVRQTFGVRMVGYEFMNRLNNKVFYENIDQVDIPELMDYHFEITLELFYGNVNSKYGCEYINLVSNLLFRYNTNKSFNELYQTKYKTRVKNLIIQYFKYDNMGCSIMIGLLELINQVMIYDTTEEYYNILKYFMEYEPYDEISRYISIISSDIYKKYS